jgi:DNA-binding MarR family transcriptional regulator
MQLVRLTALGDRLLGTLTEEHDSGERQLLGCLDDRERETLMRLLGRLQQHVAAIQPD